MLGRFAIVVSAGLLLQAIATADGAVCDPPCQNGVCASYGYCDCAEKYVGRACEFVNPCPTMDSCNNGASCWADTYSVPGQLIKRCYCQFGYSGDNCEVPDPKCSTTNSPCINGGTCRVNYDGTVTCVCALGFVGPTCAKQPAFSLNVAIAERGPKLIHVDGVFYGNVHRSYNADQSLEINTIDLDHKPSMITVAGYAGEADNFYGILVSDSTGCVVSGDAWRCSAQVWTGDWREPGFDNSVWPAAVVRGENVDGAVPAVNGGGHLGEFQPNAKWIWTADGNPYDYVYCNLKLTTSC